MKKNNNNTLIENLYPGTNSNTHASEKVKSENGFDRDLNLTRARNIRLKRLLIGSIPYILFVISISLISSGVISYIQNESVLAVFLTQRDNGEKDLDLGGANWEEDEQSQSVDPKNKAVIREGERLLVPFFYIGDEIGTLHFERIKYDVKVFQGDSESQFRLGGGHSSASYFPGQDGNIVIGAHRTNHFRNLEYVKTGDEIIFEVVYGSFKYKVDEIRIIKGSDDSVAKATSKETLTLYTCYPFVYFGNAPNRYVLICSLLESEIFK